MPSQPIKRNSSLEVISLRTISGNALMSCSSGFNSVLALKDRSPRALDRLRFPLTLPFVTFPFAFVIRFNSIGSSGL